MLITRKSLLTGVIRTLDLDVTDEQLARWEAGTVAQVVFAHLPKDQREFLITGIVQEEWDTLSTEEPPQSTAREMQAMERRTTLFREYLTRKKENKP